MKTFALPDLTFPTVLMGSRETPWDLKALLYKGGAATRRREFERDARAGKLGRPLRGRIPLVVAIHESILGAVAGGEPYYSTKFKVQLIRAFFKWADSNGEVLDASSAPRIFISWVDYEVAANMTDPAVVIGRRKGYATVAALLEDALSTTGLLKRTQLRRMPRRGRWVPAADKVSISQVRAFGNLLLDICEGLTSTQIWGTLPITIPTRSGAKLIEWSRLTPEHKLKHYGSQFTNPGVARTNALRRAAWESDRTWRTRYPVINLRLEAELLIFIAQTGMNLAQAHKLRVGNFRFRSHLAGYQVVQTYKERRGGKVEFWIYSEYRNYFERYLRWREEIFDASEKLLFPIKSPANRRAPDVAPLFSGTRKRCRQLDVPYFGPRTLRNVRTNWVARQTADSAMAAEMAQHTSATFLRNYDRPSHQHALVEISRFHTAAERALKAVGPGNCESPMPEPSNAPSDTYPQPDCVSAAGCLFCVNHRDIASFDHTWSLASYRHLKSLELALYRPHANVPFKPPATVVIERVTEKLNHFRVSLVNGAGWVQEALDRVEEGNIHPKWAGFVTLLGA